MAARALTAGVVMAVIGGVVASAFLVLASEPPAGATYLGAETCKACHFKDFKTWQAHKHSKNFEVLQGAERQNSECLKCHATGYGKPGGFVRVEKTPNLTSTGCEACHGPGSAHVEAAKNAPDTGAWDTKINKVPANACVTCHNPHINQKERVAKLREGHGAKQESPRSAGGSQCSLLAECRDGRPLLADPVRRRDAKVRGVPACCAERIVIAPSTKSGILAVNAAACDACTHKENYRPKGRSHVDMVAGAGFEPATFGL